jgi:hypothetical protein
MSQSSVLTRADAFGCGLCHRTHHWDVGDSGDGVFPEIRIGGCHFVEEGRQFLPEPMTLSVNAQG